MEITENSSVQLGVLRALVVKKINEIHPNYHLINPFPSVIITMMKFLSNLLESDDRINIKVT